MTEVHFHTLRLFVAGSTANSARAITNLTEFCRRFLPDRHSIEIVDVFLEPRRAMEEQVFLTPTLVRLAPGPALRIVGTLAHTQPLLDSLGILPTGAVG